MATYDDGSNDDRDRRDAPLAPVQPRRRGAAFWVTAALLLLAIGWGLTRLGRNADPEVAVADPLGTPVATTVAGGEVLGDTDAAGASDGVTTERPGGADASAVARFVSWANQGGNQTLPQESEGSHPYTAQGLRLLADALGAATAGLGGDHAVAIANVRRQADLLQASPDGDRHSDHAHAAFMDAARVLGALRGGETRAELTAAASRVQAGRALSPQGPQVRAYFRQAAAAMQGLAAPAGR